MKMHFCESLTKLEGKDSALYKSKAIRTFSRLAEQEWLFALFYHRYFDLVYIQTRPCVSDRSWNATNNDFRGKGNCSFFFGGVGVGWGGGGGERHKDGKISFLKLDKLWFGVTYKYALTPCLGLGTLFPYHQLTCNWSWQRTLNGNSAYPMA